MFPFALKDHAGPTGNRLTCCILPLLFLSLLLLCLPYHGIRHDSVLYLGQALAVLHPETFRHDIFFAYGSQSSYTFMPPLLAWLLTSFSASSLFLWLMLAGLLAFVLASWTLLRRLIPERWCVAGIIALLLLPASYSARATLNYAEPFLTGRTFSEPLLLFALSSMVAGKRWAALALWSFAAVLHPLQALPVLVVGWFWLIQENRHWLHLLWLVPLGIAAILLLPPLHALQLRIDSLWYSQILLRNSITLYFTNGTSHWYNLLLDIFLVAASIRFAVGKLRRLLIAMLGGMLALDLASLLLADILRLAWPTGMQFWRVHWIGHWTAIALLPWLCAQLWQQRHIDGWPRMLVFTSTIALGMIPGVAHPITPGAMLLYALWPILCKHLSPLPMKGLALLIASVAGLHLYQLLYIPLSPAALMLVQTPPPELLVRSLACIAVVAMGTFIVLKPRLTSNPAFGLPLLLLLLSTSTVAMAEWDRRPPEERAFADNPEPAPPFGLTFQPQDQVLWLHQLLPAWSLLHQSQYMDQHQMAGLVFNRGTAIEGLRRKNLLHVVDGKGKDCRLVVYPLESIDACTPDDIAMRNACERTAGRMTYFVLPYRLKTSPRGRWPLTNLGFPPYYLYACNDLRGTNAAHMPEANPDAHDYSQPHPNP